MNTSYFTIFSFLLILQSSLGLFNSSLPDPPRGKNCKRPLFYMYCNQGDCGTYNGHELECRPTEDPRYFQGNKSTLPNQCLCPKTINCNTTSNAAFTPLSGDCSSVPCIDSYGHQFNPNSTDECVESLHCFEKYSKIGKQTEFNMCLTCSECRNKNLEAKLPQFKCAEHCNGTDGLKSKSYDEDEDEEKMKEKEQRAKEKKAAEDAKKKAAESNKESTNTSSLINVSMTWLFILLVAFLL